MQIREIDLKELYTAYDVLKQLRSELTYKEFEDLIYDMRHMDYKMFGIMDKGELVTYAGVAVQTNLYFKRHLYVFDLVTNEPYRNKGYGKMMLEFLDDFARTCMCSNVVLSSDFQKEQAHVFFQKHGFEKKSYTLLKTL